MQNRSWTYKFGRSALLMAPTAGTIVADEEDHANHADHHVEDAGIDFSERIEESDELGAFAITSRSVVIDPGHGYYRDGSRWRTQRSPITFNGKTYREDFGTVEISKYIVRYLRDKGVKVYATRELNKNAGNGISGNPKWQEGAKYYLQSKGVSSSIWNNGFRCRSFRLEHCQDIYARPLYANSVGADIFVSIHSNAGGGTGTETYHDPRSTNGKKLAGKINSQVVNVARTSYANWRDRGVKSAGFAVLSRTAMPAALIEVAFHDKAHPDHAALVRDQFHRDTAKAICNGILEYFGERPTCGGNVQPLPQPDPDPIPPPKPAYPICDTRPVLKYRDGFSERAWNRANVKALQTLMNERHGYRLSVDGYFGNGTRSAVLNFQGKRFWLTNDGIVGSGTWKSLCYGL